MTKKNWAEYIKKAAEDVGNKQTFSWTRRIAVMYHEGCTDEDIYDYIRAINKAFNEMVWKEIEESDPVRKRMQELGYDPEKVGTMKAGEVYDILSEAKQHDEMERLVANKKIDKSINEQLKKAGFTIPKYDN
jgi:hypothetical protein